MSRPSTAVNRSTWVVPAVVAGVVAVLLAFVVVQATTDDGPVGPTGGVAQDAGAGLVDQERRDPDDVQAMGPVDAPVGLIVYSDYQCPFCARWAHQTLPVMAEFAEAGDLRIEWRDVNVFGEASERGARAAYAAGRQDRYWDYHEALYPDGETRSDSGLSEEALIELAGQLDLDTDQFVRDLTAPETAAEIERNAEEGLRIGAHSTPTFIVGGEAIVGAQPTEVFVELVEAALGSEGG